MELNYLLALILLVSFVCPIRLQAGDGLMRYPQDHVLKGFKEALRGLDVRSHGVPDTKMVEELEIYMLNQTDPDYCTRRGISVPNIDNLTSQLTSLLRLSTSFCSSPPRMEVVRRGLILIGEASRVTHKLLEVALDNQRRLCEEAFPREVENFKSERPNDWRMIQDLHQCHQTTTSHRENSRDTEMMIKLLAMRLPENEQQSEKAAEDVEKVLDEVMGACREFRKNIGSWFLFADSFRSSLLKEKRQVWQGYLNACSAVNNEAAVIQAVDTRCNVFRGAVDKFKGKNPQDWRLISELHSNFQKQQFSTWSENFERAMQELLEERLQEGSEEGSRKEMKERAIAVVQGVTTACENFETGFEPMFERAFYSQLPEAKQLIDYKHACPRPEMDFTEIIEKVVNDRFRPKKRNFLCCKTPRTSSMDARASSIN